MQHFYESIHGWSHFTPLYADMVRRAGDGAHFVEVGAWKGRSAAFMAVEIANSGKRIQFDCIDWGKGSGDASHVDDPDVMNGTLTQTLVHNLLPVLEYVRPRIGDSIELAKSYDDGSLDFIFLDAGHDYDSVKADIEAWWPKLKVGAVMGGDDIQWPGVVKAVSELLPGAHAEGVVANFYPWWKTTKASE